MNNQQPQSYRSAEQESAEEAVACAQIEADQQARGYVPEPIPQAEPEPIPF